jgi:energy-coupling factor transporter transmembrane protein EcfT
MISICNPLLFFIILVSVWLIVILFSNAGNKGQMVVQTLVWGFILALLIYYFCSVGKITWAWIVVFLPIIISVIITMLFIFGFSVGMGIQTGKNYGDLMNYLSFPKK